jgi:perosamine synthetase
MISVCEPSIGLKEYLYVFRALRSNWLTCGGEYVNRFEKEIARYCGAKYGVALSSGTAALHMALLALGVGKGDEVIVPSLSFVAVASMVKLVGATPVVVDVKEDTWLINRIEVGRAITSKTKAVIVMDLYGTVCDVDNIRTYAPNIPIIVDACESLGAKRDDIGDIMCLSFQSTKIITTGEGGACVTNSKVYADRIRYLKDHAMDEGRKYYHSEVGFNYRMSEIQGALGVSQLERIESLLKKKAQIADWYYDELRSVVGIEYQRGHTLGSNWVFPILVENRDELMAYLKENGVETRISFYPIHAMPPYREYAKPCPVSNELSRKGMFLPSGVNLKKSQIKYICDVIKRCVGKS